MTHGTPAAPLVFDHNLPAQRILFGTGLAAEHVQTAMRQLDPRAVLVITGASSQAVAHELAAQLPTVGVIADVEQHVPIARATAAIEYAQSTGADAVLAIGGGSAIGLAKILARDLGIPIVAVPTTFSGSEATMMWGLTEAGVKRTGVDPRVMPRVVVYDAALTVSLPTELVAASGMNAIAHAVDGFWAPGANPINTALGAEGLRELAPALRALVHDGADVGARERVFSGSYLAASAFATAGSALHHKICHVLGGMGMPHAPTHAVMIAYVADFYSEYATDACDRIRAALGSEAVGAGLQQLNRALGGPASLTELGFDPATIPEVVAAVLPIVPANSPRAVTAQNLTEMLVRAATGEPLS